MRQIPLPILSLLFLAGGACCWAQNPGGPAGPRGAAPPPISENHAASERLFNSWKTPQAPRHIIGNINYVGLGGVSSWLITTPDGNILIDTTFDDCVPRICDNIEKLGFHVRDIKLLLSTHTHSDHTGGHAAMKQRTGAQIVASAADARILETGGVEDFSPFPKDLMAYPPVKADRIVQDGETVTLGGVTLTAHLTPGHTKGATTWTMPLQVEGKTYHVMFFSSVSIAEPTPLLDNPHYPGIADDFAATFKKLKTLPCDIFLAPHADQFGLAGKLARLDAGATPNPFIDPDGWKKVLTNGENAFLKQLAAEKAARTNAQTSIPAHRFENNVRLYEALDKTNPPPRDAILLVGDSQFYRWKTLNEDLPGYTIINRGIDSFETSDLLYFADRLVRPYQARMIIMHVGGNDVHGGKSAEQVLTDFKAFVARVRAVQPNVPIAFSSMTPGPARWEEAGRRKEANQIIKNYIATQPGLLYIDLWDAMLTPEGKPRMDLWVADNIHPNHDGYRVRVKIMLPLLGEPDKKSP